VRDFKVGDLVTYELSASGEGPRWDYDYDLGGGGAYGQRMLLAKITEADDRIFVTMPVGVPSPADKWQWPQPSCPDYGYLYGKDGFVWLADEICEDDGQAPGAKPLKAKLRRLRAEAKQRQEEAEAETIATHATEWVAELEKAAARGKASVTIETRHMDALRIWLRQEELRNDYGPNAYQIIVYFD
jgi:hypothetical protein